MKLIKTALASSVLGLALLGGTEVSAQAQPKIATIDLRKVFDGYYKTKQADVSLKEEATAMEKDRKEMVDNFKKGEEEWKKLIDKANDQAVSGEEREKSKQAGEKKLLELREMEQMITQFNRNATEKLGTKQKRMREKILAEIREVITTKARTSNYTVVLDSASDSFNQTPILLYTNGENDLTDTVLTEINASGPATLKPAEKK